MGNILGCDDNKKIIEQQNTIKEQQNTIKILEEELFKIKEELFKIKEEIKLEKDNKGLSTSEYIDNYIDNWFEKNKEDVDIGEIKIAGFKVDLLPDKVEKHIYKKILKILLTLLSEFKYN